MFSPRCGHSLTKISKPPTPGYISTHIIIASGSNSKSSIANSIEFYDLSTSKWLEGPDMIQPRYLHASIVLESRYLYVFGGRDPVEDKAVGSIERLDILEGKDLFEEVRVKGMIERDTMGVFGIGGGKVVLFGGDIGWVRESWEVDLEKGEVVSKGVMGKGDMFWN
jgi:hypothetical protein